MLTGNKKVHISITTGAFRIRQAESRYRYCFAFSGKF
jgi:hypothetical protein